jgi:addiction module RelE/StbE family toxin
LKVLFAPQARQDLDDIVDYLLQENADMAKVVLDRIMEAIRSLAEMPHLGRPGRVPGTRELVAPRTPFVVPYQVSGNTVEILRVYHGARRWPDHF